MFNRLDESPGRGSCICAGKDRAGEGAGGSFDISEEAVAQALAQPGLDGFLFVTG